MRTIHPIELESFAILRERVATDRLPALSRAVVERIIHASADVDYLKDTVCDEDALASGLAALRRGAPVVADVEMVAAGITGHDVVCRVGDSRAADVARTAGMTRSAAGIQVALGEVGPGAVWVVGCAPTALFALLDLAERARPALVVGMPVGFVGAAESKAALRASGLPSVTNVSEKGGSAVAAAAFNALLYVGEDPS